MFSLCLRKELTRARVLFLGVEGEGEIDMDIEIERAYERECERQRKAIDGSIRFRHIYGEGEWKMRRRGAKNEAEYDCLEEEDKEVFMEIDRGIAEEESRNRSYYVYLSVSLYNRLKEGAQKGLSGKKLCAYCDIMPSKLRKLREKYVKLGERLEALSDKLVTQALVNIAENVMKNGDLKDSKWILERLDREHFGKGTSSVSMEVNHRHTMDIEKIKEIRGELLAIRDSGTNLETEGYHDTSKVVEEQARKKERRDRGEIIDV